MTTLTWADGQMGGPQEPPGASFILHSEEPSLPSKSTQGLCVHLHSSLLTAGPTDSRGWGSRLQNLTSLSPTLWGSPSWPQQPEQALPAAGGDRPRGAHL